MAFTATQDAAWHRSTVVAAAQRFVDATASLDPDKLDASGFQNADDWPHMKAPVVFPQADIRTLWFELLPNSWTDFRAV